MLFYVLKFHYMKIFPSAQFLEKEEKEKKKEVDFIIIIKEIYNIIYKYCYY